MVETFKEDYIAKDDDALYIYSYEWDEEIVPATANATYTAKETKDYKQSIKDLIEDAEGIIRDESIYEDDYIDSIKDQLDILDDSKEPVASDADKIAAVTELGRLGNDAENNKKPANYAEYDEVFAILETLKDNDKIKDELHNKIMDHINHPLPRDIKKDKQSVVDTETNAIKALLS